MAYRTFETDKDGKLTIYPSLYDTKQQGICRSLRSLARKLFAQRVK
jgi:hypothetical protein